MYKTLLRFSIFIIIIAILFAVYVLLYLSNQSNNIVVDPNQYVEILEQVHNNIDMYVGKKFTISGYVYVQEDFSGNRFVIAQNVYIDSISSEEPFIIGFLCENHSNTTILPNETIQIQGILDKVIYNNSTYPILLVDKIM